MINTNEFKNEDVRIGYATLNGKRVKVFFNPDSYCNESLKLIGKMGPGKKTHIKDYVEEY